MQFSTFAKLGGLEFSSGSMVPSNLAAAELRRQLVQAASAVVSCAKAGGAMSRRYFGPKAFVVLGLLAGGLMLAAATGTRFPADFRLLHSDRPHSVGAAKVEHHPHPVDIRVESGGDFDEAALAKLGITREEAERMRDARISMRTRVLHVDPTSASR